MRVVIAVVGGVGGVVVRVVVVVVGVGVGLVVVVLFSSWLHAFS